MRKRRSPIPSRCPACASSAVRIIRSRTGEAKGFFSGADRIAMKLPNAERAAVEYEKLRDYCLSRDHPRGRHKARVCGSALGLTMRDAGMLQEALLDAAQSSDAVLGMADEY